MNLDIIKAILSSCDSFSHAVESLTTYFYDGDAHPDFPEAYLDLITELDDHPEEYPAMYRQWTELEQKGAI